MSNLKKIRKKLLTSVLGTTLLTGGLVGIQSVSAMSSNKTKLEKRHKGVHFWHRINL